MKANLIENLIIAHCSGDESRFSSALEELIEDESRKGNVPTASRFRRAYKPSKKTIGSPSKEFSPSASFSSSQLTAPLDKDSLLSLYDIVTPDVSLDEVVLPEPQKKIIQQLIDEQNKADLLLSHNIQPANRVLLCGPPGCGKTMTAYAISNALHLPMAYVRLDGLVSSYLGQTSTNLRKVFDSVHDRRIVLFLDEFDAIAKKRDDANELGELKRVVTTLLQNFDALPANVILLAATNHEQLLDSAIWRRFNFTMNLLPPSADLRKKLIEKDLHHYDISSKINTTTLAKITAGMSGARIHELMGAAAKKNLLDGKLATNDVAAILIQQKTKYSSSNDDSMSVICGMLANGVSLRTASVALGISHSTLEYRVAKYKEAHPHEQ